MRLVIGRGPRPQGLRPPARHPVRAWHEGRARDGSHRNRQPVSDDGNYEMIRITRAWVAHHKTQYGINWRHVSARFLAELAKSQGKKEKPMSSGA